MRYILSEYVAIFLHAVSHLYSSHPHVKFSGLIFKQILGMRIYRHFSLGLFGLLWTLASMEKKWAKCSETSHTMLPFQPSSTLLNALDALNMHIHQMD